MQDLLRYMKESKGKSTNEKLELFLGISDKIMAMLSSLASQNKQLDKRIKKLEYLNKPAPHMPVSALPPPPPPHTVPTPYIKRSNKGGMMRELKVLFEKRKLKDGLNDGR